MLPGENKRHNAAAGCDVENTCSTKKQVCQRFDDRAPNDTVRVIPHAAYTGKPVHAGHNASGRGIYAPRVLCREHACMLGHTNWQCV